MEILGTEVDLGGPGREAVRGKSWVPRWTSVVPGGGSPRQILGTEVDLGGRIPRGFPLSALRDRGSFGWMGVGIVFYDSFGAGSLFALCLYFLSAHQFRPWAVFAPVTGKEPLKKFYLVVFELRIYRGDGDFFQECLSNQDPVKRVRMMPWERSNMEGVAMFNQQG